MKILRVGMTYPRDSRPGIGLHAYYYSKHSNFDEMILTLKRPGIMPENREGVQIIEIDAGETELIQIGKTGVVRRSFSLMKKAFDQCMFFIKAKKYIDSFQPDVVHLFSPIPILCGVYAKKKYNSGVVMSLHGSDALRISKEKMYAKLLQFPDAVVTVGDDMIGLLDCIKLKRPIEYIGNGVDITEFRNLHHHRENQFVHVANLRWQKGQEYLIDGFALFLKKYPDYKLVVIGEGPEQNTLQSKCDALGISDRVEFKGTQGREAIVQELNRSKAFVLTSVSEGFPKVIIEAMATGTPVISSDAGNIKKVVGNVGIIFPMKDNQEVCKAMEDIVTYGNWKELSRMSEEIGREYSWEKVVDKLERIYLEVAGR